MRHPCRPWKCIVAALLFAGLPRVSAIADGGARPFHLALYHVGFWVRDIAKSRAFYHDYLGFDEPYDLHYANGRLQMVVMKVNENQVIYLFPNAAKILPDGDNLDHLGLETDDATAVHDYLADHGLKVGTPKPGHIGDLIMGIRDPDGHVFEVTQFEPQGQLLKHRGMGLAASRISSRLLSAEVSVSDLTASLHFYRDLLGFKEVGRSGPADASISVRLQAPDGGGILDLRPYRREAGVNPPRAVPEFSLEVADSAKAAATLASRAAAGGFPPPTPLSASLDGRLRTSCVDPDGTRVGLTGP